MNLSDIECKEDSVVITVDVDGILISTAFRKDEESRRLVEKEISVKGNAQEDIAPNEPTLGELEKARTKARRSLEENPDFSDFKIVMSEEILRTIMAEKVEWGLPSYRQCRFTLTLKKIIVTRGGLSVSVFGKALLAPRKDRLAELLIQGDTENEKPFTSEFLEIFPYGKISKVKAKKLSWFRRPYTTEIEVFTDDFSKKYALGDIKFEEALDLLSSVLHDKVIRI